MTAIGTLAVFSVFALFLPCPATAADPDPKAAKEALQTLNDFVDVWDGPGKSADQTWNETLEWGWSFQTPDPRMTLKFKDGKFFRSGEVRYDAEKKAFEATLVDVQDRKRVFTGKLHKETFTLERVDAESKATERFTLKFVSDGICMAASFEHRPDGGPAFTQDFAVKYSRPPFLGRRRECIVTGAWGFGAVTYKGVSYGCCCSGCREAFNAHREQYVQEWEEKKGKK